MATAATALTPRIYDAQLHAQYAGLYERVRERIPLAEWSVHLPYIDAIQTLKRARRAVILAYNYQAPEIYYGVADITGDSLALAQRAAATMPMPAGPTIRATTMVMPRFTKRTV